MSGGNRAGRAAEEAAEDAAEDAAEESAEEVAEEVAVAGGWLVGRARRAGEPLEDCNADSKERECDKTSASFTST